MNEAIILAGGKAERLGDAAGGLPKAAAGGRGGGAGGGGRGGGAGGPPRPLAAYQVALLRAADVTRVIVSCAVGQGPSFQAALGGPGVEIVPVEEREPLGRGGGLRLAARARTGRGPLYALNGDELFDVDLRALAALHERAAAAATIAVCPLRSAFGIVDLEGDVVTGFREAPLLPHWVSCGLYVLGEEALELLPERGDHERSTFPELAAAGRLRAYRHEGAWLTVNTPKELRAAEAYVVANPGWPAAP